jgi:hypothetical protein
MDWMDGLNTFHFDNHEALDYEVDAIAECDFLSGKPLAIRLHQQRRSRAFVIRERDSR